VKNKARFRILTRRAAAFYPVVLFILWLPASARTADPDSARIPPAGLEREIVRLAESVDGTVGVCAVHAETGMKVSLNGSRRFPMASTVKVPIAVILLDAVDRGELRLDRMVDIRPGDLVWGSGILADLFTRPGLELSVGNLLELMLLVSDNSATDGLLGVLGGAAAVDSGLRRMGIEGIRVDRSIRRLIFDWSGVARNADSLYSVGRFDSLFNALPAESRRAAARAYAADPRDSATPEGMADVLLKIHRGDLLGPESRALLLDIMGRCRTGAKRLKGALPWGASAAHKTGTLGGTVADVGILTLPGNAGHVAIAVFVQSPEDGAEERDRVIADIARAVNDYFVFAFGGR
jgi:beta-lactamase class A